MLRWLGVLLAVVPVVVLLSAFSETWMGPNDYGGMPSPGAMPSPTSYPLLQRLLAHASPQVRAGAHTYHVVCATCHGPTGKGLAEARLAFIPGHRRCEECHRPGNPPRWSDTMITPHNSFSIGNPPALRGTDLLQEYPTPSALFHFLRKAMPRYDPGKFSDQTYVQLTAFLWALNGAMPSSNTLTGPVADLAPGPKH
jgi:hypothetical protein